MKQEFVLDHKDDTVLQVGSASAADATDDETRVYAAVLWVPDPTERRGWRDMWIERKKDIKPKIAGYRRNAKALDKTGTK